MNIINRHADKFYPIMIEQSKFMTQPDLCIQEARFKIMDYHKYSQRVIFLERLIINARSSYDEHLKDCRKGEECNLNSFFEDLIFYLNEEVEENSKYITTTEFNTEERIQLDTFQNDVIAHLKTLSLGQEIIHEDLTNEIAEMKEYLYLNKRNWMQLFAGKLLEMVVGGVIEESTAKSILDFVKSEYSNLIDK